MDLEQNGYFIETLILQEILLEERSHHRINGSGLRDIFPLSVISGNICLWLASEMVLSCHLFSALLLVLGIF